MERLDVQLLGGVEVTLDGRPVEFESDTARALLARVAAAPVGETVTRAAIAEMLWPERPEGAARANLRHTLASVRHAIGDVDADVPFLKVSRTSLGVDPLASAHVDVAELRRLAATSPDAPGAVAAWDRAAALRRGPFLDGLDPPVDATWEEWVRAVRAELDQVAVEALRRVADVRERAGELAEARRVARRWIELEPWDERAHRLVARTLAAERQAARAVDHLERFAGRLREELGVEATAETIALLEAVRAGAAVTPAPVVAARKAPGPVMQLVDRGDELH
ncbi:MAG: BTAD domain-containing putative transcriptional regulator, partial [Actinomycetota bacterium]|nr:BTAD domain-containing putative transcriptional regulator [Actinomycetota bacterium]